MDLAYKLPCLLVLAKPVTKKTEWLFQGYQRGRLFSWRRFPFNSCLEWKWSSILPSILHPVGDHFWLLAKPSGYILIFHYICFFVLLWQKTTFQCLAGLCVNRSAMLLWPLSKWFCLSSKASWDQIMPDRIRSVNRVFAHLPALY